MDSVAHRRDLVAAATERMRRLFAHHTMVCLCSMQTIFNIEIYNSLLSTKITLQVETFWIIKKEKTFSSIGFWWLYLKCFDHNIFV